MVTGMNVYYALLVVIAFERLAELVVSQRHATGLLRRGGVEYGRGPRRSRPPPRRRTGR